MTGKDILKWFKKHYPTPDDAKKIIKEMTEQSFLHHIAGPELEKTERSLYKF